VRSIDREHAMVLCRQFALGMLVLSVTCLVANLTSFRIAPGEAVADRLADHLIGRLSAIGYLAQLGTGLWLSMSLLFDIVRGRKAAAVLWVASLCLYLAPLPSLTADLALAPALLVLAACLGLLGHKLLETP